VEPSNREPCGACYLLAGDDEEDDVTSGFATKSFSKEYAARDRWTRQGNRDTPDRSSPSGPRKIPFVGKDWDGPRSMGVREASERHSLNRADRTDSGQDGATRTVPGYLGADADWKYRAGVRRRAYDKDGIGQQPRRSLSREQDSDLDYRATGYENVGQQPRRILSREADMDLDYKTRQASESEGTEQQPGGRSSRAPEPSPEFRAGEESEREGASSPDFRLSDQPEEGVLQSRKILSRAEARRRDDELMQQRSWWGGGGRGSAALQWEEDEGTRGGVAWDGSSLRRSSRNGGRGASRGRGRDGERRQFVRREEREGVEMGDSLLGGSGGQGLQRGELAEIFESICGPESKGEDGSDVGTANRRGLDLAEVSRDGPSIGSLRQNWGDGRRVERESWRSSENRSIGEPDRVAVKESGGAFERWSESAVDRTSVKRLEEPSERPMPERQRSKQREPEIPEGGWTFTKTAAPKKGVFAERVEHKAFTPKVPEFIKSGGRSGLPQRRYGAGGDEWAQRESKWFGEEAGFQAKHGPRDTEDGKRIAKQG
jgi:hypothetical protein